MRERIEKDIDQRLLNREKQDLLVEQSNQARKSYFVQDEYFDNSPLPDHLQPKISPEFQRMLNYVFGVKNEIK